MMRDSIYRYAHMEDFAGIAFPDFRAYGGKLVVYGAGINGMLCAYALEAMGAAFACFVDADPDKQGGAYCGHPVISPEQMRARHPGWPVLLDVYNYREVLGELRAWGYEDIISPASVFLGMDLDAAAAYVTARNAEAADGGGYNLRERIDAGQVREWIESYFVRGADFYTDGNDLPRAVNLDVTDRCTLRCKGCLGLKPFYRNGAPDMRWEEMSRVVDRLLSLRHFRRFHILGGEPLLYRDLGALLERLCAEDAGVDQINIITNATLLPDPALVERLRDERVCVRISYYGDLSARAEALQALCAREGIACVVHAQRWQDIGTVLDVPHDDAETRRVFRGCCQRSGSYVYVAHGRCHPCPFAANGEALGAFAPHEGDSADLLACADADEVREAMRAYYFRAEPYAACRVCMGWFPFPFGKSIPVAEQYAGDAPALPRYM